MKYEDQILMIISSLRLHRGVGRTTQLINAADKDTTIIAHDHKFAHEIGEQLREKKSGAVCIALNQTSEFYAHRPKKYLIDNMAMELLLSDAMHEIDSLRTKLAQIKQIAGSP